ncbi:uncharacterized protein BCR38DRAFT_45851 [Pseudomassariella vexata]|uniref:Uncharacterized protein n=1 Tax=Pseudomassariella vexata TaxID=1141098 RepID=A0A1Y2DN56_9PEZI|nr:uncharacterized protein BCR38DRAFT_45851 [Pseudomassariella vexata]ORY60733.1 hypothetical protein BCR38DRAFT_45851 [Pseudomassariella vexata]
MWKVGRGLAMCPLPVCLWESENSTRMEASILPYICASGLPLHIGDVLGGMAVHALVLATYHLANSGILGETLFGMVACLVCLLTFRADPCTKVEVSIQEFLGHNQPDQCQHSPMDAAELGSSIPIEIINSWTPGAQLGWKAFMAVLQSNITQRSLGKVDNDRTADARISNTDHEDSDHENDRMQGCDSVIHYDEQPYGPRSFIATAKVWA